MMLRKKSWKTRVLCLALTAVLGLGTFGTAAAAQEAPVDEMAELVSALREARDATAGEGAELAASLAAAMENGTIGEAQAETQDAQEPVYGDAAGEEAPTQGRNVRQSKQGLGELDDWNSAEYYAAAPGVYSSGDMRSQLTARQQEFYDELAGLSVYDVLGLDRTGSEFSYLFETASSVTVEMTGYYDGSNFMPDAASESVERALYSDMCVALEAVREDYPDKIWMTLMKYGYYWETAGDGRYKVAALVYDFDLMGLEQNNLIAGIWTLTENQANNLASVLNGQNYSLAVKLGALYTVLGEANSYNVKNDPVSELFSHWAYSALDGDVDGSNDYFQPVCDGYSKAYKLILDKMNVPCMLPVSDDHMWNNVQMEDGLWYNIDLTWGGDDPQNINYEYFLAGSQTVMSGYNKPFYLLPSHTEANPYRYAYYELDPFVLRFPVKSMDAYNPEKPAATPSFTDVTTDDWCFDEVEEARRLGIIAGDPNGAFRPYAQITRAEIAKALANAMGADLSQYQGQNGGYRDVPVKEWFAPAVAWAQAQGYMLGDKGLFRPYDKITRQEICMVFFNLNGKRDSAGTVPSFGDSAKVADWARRAVNYCAAEDIIRGDTHGNCLPVDNAQRCAVAAIFVRYLTK